MHGKFTAPATAYLVLAVAACRGDSTGTAASPVALRLLASRHEAAGAPRFSAWSAPVNLGPPINTTHVESGASISRDGRTLYFHCLDCPENVGGADIWVSQRARIDDPWGPPQRLGSNVNTTANETAPTLSSDGRQLFFARDGQTGFGGTDLYVSGRRDKRDDFAWEPAVNLGSGVNTTANEAQASLFEDEETEISTLYFSSNRSGGPGLDDIYASTLQPDGTFGLAVLVPELNSSSNDRQPAVRRAGNVLRLRPGGNARRHRPLGLHARDDARPVVHAGEPGAGRQHDGDRRPPGALVRRHHSLLPVDPPRRTRTM